MDRIDRLPEEYACDRPSENHSGVSSLEFRDVSHLDGDAIAALIPIFREAYETIFGEKISHKVTHFLLGSEVTMEKAEELLYWYLNTGHQIKSLYLDQKPIGILVYLPIFDKIIGIRLLFVLPEFTSAHAGKGLIDAARPNRVLFQTLKSRPPLRLKQIVKHGRIISETELVETWEMEWKAE